MRQTAIRSGIRCERKAAVLKSTNRENRSGSRVASSHPNGSAPIVGEERDVAEIQSGDEPFEVGDVLRQSIRIILRFVGKTAADVVDGQHAVAAAKAP